MERPKRLSNETRGIAEKYRSGEMEKYLRETEFVDIETEGFDALPPHARYAAAIRTIAEKIPVLIHPGELIVGSACLFKALDHVVPAAKDGMFPFPSISHTTCNFERMLKTGYAGALRDIEQQIESGSHNEKGMLFLQSAKSCLESAGIFHARYCEKLLELGDDYSDVYNNLKNVPFNPPDNFREAVQALWFMFVFLRSCGNWPGIGRIDKMLGPFLEKDLALGRIDMDTAREYLAHFWIRGCEWIVRSENVFNGTGDAQYYQNIVIGGIDEFGRDVANEITYLVIDIIEELNISDFPTSVRIGRKTDDKLIKRAADALAYGGGILAFYNEDVAIDSLVRIGFPVSEARNFANDGCWEIQVPGKTKFGYFPLDLLCILQDYVLCLKNGRWEEDPGKFDVLKSYKRYKQDCEKQEAAEPHQSFESLYSCYRNELYKALDCVRESFYDFIDRDLPASLIGIFTDGCIQRGRDFNDQGPDYTFLTPHAGGLPDTANALYAIKKLVYDEKRITLPELIKVLQNNWEGHEELRLYSRNKLTYYGNDTDEADDMVVRLYHDFCDNCLQNLHAVEGVWSPPGISTFGRQIEWAETRGATANGCFAGEILSQNIDPAPGTDKKGATAVIKSYSKLGMRRLAGSTALDLKIDPSALEGGGCTQALSALLKGFVELDGFFVHIDVVDNETLRDAQKHPEKYQGLAVRVSGWSARFVTLSEEWQRMIIERTTQGLS